MIEKSPHFENVFVVSYSDVPVALLRKHIAINSMFCHIALPSLIIDRKIDKICTMNTKMEMKGVPPDQRVLLLPAVTQTSVEIAVNWNSLGGQSLPIIGEDIALTLATIERELKKIYGVVEHD